MSAVTDSTYLGMWVHIGCNTTAAGNSVVSAGMKVKKTDGKIQPHPSLPIGGKTYIFDDVM